MKAVTENGKDYKKILSILKNKTQRQVISKVQGMRESVISNPTHENAKYAKILKKLPRRVKHVWTDEQNKKFNAALQKYGRSFKVIAKLFPAMTYIQIRHHALLLRTAI